MTMANVGLKVERDYDLSSARGWEVLGDIGDISWARPASRSIRAALAPGMTRGLHMPDIELVDGVLEMIDHAVHSFSYTTRAAYRLPIAGSWSRSRHLATIAVAPIKAQWVIFHRRYSGAYAQML